MQASPEVSPAVVSVSRGVGVGGFGGVLARLIGALPTSLLPRLGAFVGWFAGTLLRIRRAHVERAMKEAGIGRETTGDLASSMYRSLGSSLVEALWFAAHPKVPASSVATLDEWSLARLDAARQGGRGAVIATAHAGNWEIAAAALAEGRPLTAVVKPMHVRWVERFCRESRSSRGIAVVRAGEVMSAGRAALRRGETVAMMIDQVPHRARHACEGEFLSRAVDIDRSPAVLAARAGVPLIVAVARRVGATHQRLEVLAVLYPPERGRMAWAEGAARTANRLLERWVHAHPSEWLWMHRRWRRVA